MSVNEGLAPAPSSEITNHHRRSRKRRIDLLSELIRQDLGLMSAKAVKDGMDQLVVQMDKAQIKFNELGTRNQSLASADAADGDEDDHTHLKQLERDLQLLKNEVSKIKSVFPFSLVIKPTPPDSHINRRDRFTPHSVFSTPDDKLMQNLASYEAFNRTPTFDELEASFRGLKSRSRICLICFLVFPENAITKKSLLVCWGKANRIDFMEEPIDQLVGNGLIQPVYKDTLTLGGYWMHPSARSTMIDKIWHQVLDFTEWVYVDSTSKEEEDIIYDDPAQFSAKKKLGVLHLGNWQQSSVRHIEIEDPDSFFKDMAELSKLRFFSLRGVSLVTELPKFITKLKDLEILDLKACHNLEILPSDIGKLWRSLTHLDLSECYFLEHMPMALARLCNLRVLKGFFVGEAPKENSCALQDLLPLEDLMKLSIYTSVKGFPNNGQLSILKEFKSLQSLTISWGGCSRLSKMCNSEDFAKADVGQHQQRQEEHHPATTSNIYSHFEHVDSLDIYAVFRFNIEKLDLQCVPAFLTPDWLKPSNFKHLKRLYIRGGEFCNLGVRRSRRLEEDEWNVEILRLNHLSNLEMDYSELKGLFPKLICLENVECPKLKDFPPDEITIWKDAATQPPPTTFL